MMLLFRLRVPQQGWRSLGRIRATLVTSSGLLLAKAGPVVGLVGAVPAAARLPSIEPEAM